jgi:hypothetical protein
MRCNICGSSDFIDVRNRKNAMCANCRSYERTRLMFMYIERDITLTPSSRVLHMAPERGLYDFFRAKCGDNYTAIDINPKVYDGMEVRPFDLCKDVFSLERNYYDLIVHNHVLEHLPCNETAVLIRLTNSLTDNGVHVFSIPVAKGAYEADLGNRDGDERERRFGQDDHVRRFGREDMERSLGMVFDVSGFGNHLNHFTAAQLEAHNIPQKMWRAYNVFKLRKADLRI